MATLDLQEQEQLDNLKAFWAKWGNLISTLLTLGLLAFAGWNGWNMWQRKEGLKASVLYDEVERASQTKDADKTQRMFVQMRDQMPRSAYTAQAALLTAGVLQVAGKAELAQQDLEWATGHGPEVLRELAQLRLAGLHLEAKRFPQAEAALAEVKSPAYAALAADRRGDLAQLQNQADKAREHYKAAYQAMAAEQPYRQLIEAKLTALGVDVAGLKTDEHKDAH